MAKYFSERVFMIELLGELNFFYTFHLSPNGELVRYNEKFQPQEVVVEVAKDVIGDSFCVKTCLGFCFRRDFFSFCM